MGRVIVTVKVEGLPEARDLEVPATEPAGRLAERIALALGRPPGPYSLEAFPPGRVLAPGETLAEAGAWEGAWLIISEAG
jgi:hypothetical protein